MDQPTESTTTDSDEPKAKHPHGNNTGLKQAYEWRDAAHSEAMALKDMPCESLEDRVARAKALQSLNTVWFNAGDRIRVLRGKPLPGSLRPEKKPAKPKRNSLPPPTDIPHSAFPIPHSDKESLTRGDTVPTPPTPNSPT